MRKSGLTGDEAYILSKRRKATEDLGPLKKEIGLLKEDLSNKITKFYASNQGETHLADSDKGKIMDMMLYGKSSQFTTTGKNLANGQNINCFINSAADTVGISINDIGMVIDASKLTNVSISTRSIQDRYRFACADTVPIRGNPITCYNGAVKDGTKDSYTIDTTGYNYLFINATKLEDIQVEKGSVSTSYEPYTGGIPSPSPDYPQEIKSVVNPTIKICGKNLFDSKKFPIILNRAISGSTGNIYVLSSGNYCAIEKYIPFPYSGKKISFNASMSLYAYDQDYKYISIINKHNGQVPSGTIYVRFDIEVEDKDKVQIELSENTTTYEPYKEQTIQLPITLNAIPVSSGGNVTIGEQQYISDYVDVEKGKLYRKVKRLNLKDADDTRIAYGRHSNGNGYLSFSNIKNVNEEQQPISNRYKGSAWTSESGYVYIPSSNSIVFVDDRFTDKQTAIKLVQDTYAIYVLSSQTEEDLSLEQIKSLKSLSTNYPVTNCDVGSEELDGYTVFNYPISMANGWNYVKKQLNDNRDYIYDMDIQSAEAYVNSEYAVALTELEV
nr:MAG TPA: hypothetical protein [Caudoviricetes sp.]